VGTAIAWTNETWNPTTGCSRVSEGCRACYAEVLSLRNGWSKKPWTKANEAENVREHPARLKKPFSWKEPKRIFVNSMSDMFHEVIDPAFRARIFEVMVQTPRHTYQILTKRADLAAAWPGPWPANIWQGVSVEDRKSLPRIDALRRCGAQTRFLSLEPLLEDLGPLNLDGIHWVIVGGESGAAYRAMDHAWARGIRDQCVAAGVPFFFKQSAAPRTEMGTSLVETDGSRWIWKQYPGDLAPPICTHPAPGQREAV
jgi:protein gp37